MKAIMLFLICFSNPSMSLESNNKILINGGAALTVCSGLKNSCSDSANDRLSIGYHGNIESCNLSVSRLKNIGMKGQPKCKSCKYIYYDPSSVTQETICERD
jgi:hypothetical protein